jgi:hypothetical protein
MVHVASVRDVDGETMSTSITSRFSAAAPNPPTKADVNGDGYDDVIVGAPDEDFGTKTDAGVVHVLFGSATGTKTSGSQMFTQDTANVPDTAEAGDRFGAAIATGDVNNDGYDDVAVGVPGENVGSISDAGAVHLMLGSSTGLRATGSQFWTQDSSGIPDAAQTADRFGSSLAFGDFDNTAGADLAVGSPNETLGTFAGAGAVHVLSGRSGGLTASGSQFWTQQNIDGFEAPGNKFGTSLASVDFDGDTHDDLAIGAPYEDIFEGDEGTVTLMRGTIVGLRPLFSVFSEILTGVEAAKGERFGASLSSEDFGGLAETDGYEDLAVGAPGASSGAGRVDVLYSDWIGPLVDVRSVEQTGNGNDPEAGDAFGGALAAGRFKGSPYAWLAIAATGEDFGSVSNAGVVHLVTPKSWIASSPSVTAPLTEDTTNIPDSAETEDRFGNSVRLLDVDKDGKPDMIVGVPNETVGSATLAGRAYVIRNAPSSSRTAQMLNQGSGGVPETAQGGDRFGFALGG